MGITDELREWANLPYKTRAAFDELIHIADRIDEAHKHAIGHVDSRDSQTMADNGWVKLPVDADGVPIHLGDKVYQRKGGWVYTVKSITLHPDDTTVAFDCKHGFGCDSPHNLRHYHAPTVDFVWQML